MKKLKTGIGCLIFSFLFFMAYHSQAQTLYVYDEADLLSEVQEQNLQGWAEEKKETEKQNFVFLTSDDTGNQDTKTYADQFYDSHGFEKQDGILFFIDMDNRQRTISTTGSMRSYMTDEKVSAVLEEVKQYASDGAYNRVFTELGEKAVTSLREMEHIPSGTDREKAETVKQKGISISEAGGAFLAAFVSGAIFFFVILRKYNMKIKTSAYSYWENAAIDMTIQTDHLIHRTVTRRRIEREETETGTAEESGGQNQDDHGGGSVGF